MNNIEILEEFINKQKSNKGTFVATDFEITALENLIEENKELSKLLEEKTMRIEFENIENYIPKSKVKEKIEEYNKMINATYGDITACGDYRRNVCFEIRKVLTELLEEGE